MMIPYYIPGFGFYGLVPIENEPAIAELFEGMEDLKCQTTDLKDEMSYAESFSD